MGAVTNVVRNKASGVCKAEAFSMSGQMRALRTNAAQGLGKGSKITPIVGEMRDVVEGIT